MVRWRAARSLRLTTDYHYRLVILNRARREACSCNKRLEVESTKWIGLHVNTNLLCGRECHLLRDFMGATDSDAASSVARAVRERP